MENNPIKLSQLLTKDKYIIPIYQRNYAWGRDQIESLINDIDTNAANNKPYYLGTLVVYKDGDDYEVIDGQQRLITINLINIYLNEALKQAASDINLTYSAREECTNYLSDLNNNIHNEIPTSCRTMSAGFEIISNYCANNITDINNFADNFREHTFLFLEELPKETDLNHYFEVMNSRGVQLEQHEILKARLLGLIKKPDGSNHDNYQKACNLFNTIWDACSNMNSYVMQNLPTDVNFNDLNDNLGNSIPSSNTSNTNNNQQSQDSPFDVNYKYPKWKGNTEPSEKYHSIIDFPNFLLIVLGLIQKPENIILDDHKLLSTYNEYFNPNENRDNDRSVKDFIKILLKYRILFDNYVIKSESSDFNNQHWILESYSKESGLKKTFENDNNIIMLQSMLQTSFSSYSNKKWLYKLMTDINDTIKGEKTTLDVIEESSLTEYANRYAKEVIKRDGFSLNNGTNTNHFIFNYLDYLLWQEWEKVRSNQSNQSDPLLSHIAKCEDDFSKFSFRYRDSIEHIQPQTPITDDEHNSSDNYINSFGNLCLISSNSNSQYSNRGIEDKFKIFQDKRKNGVVESGKQALIMQMAKDSDNSFSWNEDKIKEHGTEMIDFLIKAINDDECEKK